MTRVVFTLHYAETAIFQFEQLEKSKHLKAQYKAVCKALRLLTQNPKHPGLHTHEYSSLIGPGKSKVWEAYAQNRTPGAYRIFFSYYPPKSNTIHILAIVPHPK